VFIGCLMDSNSGSNSDADGSANNVVGVGEQDKEVWR
jgi:hypothetical protein